MVYHVRVHRRVLDATKLDEGKERKGKEMDCGLIQYCPSISDIAKFDWILLPIFAGLVGLALWYRRRK